MVTNTTDTDQCSKFIDKVREDKFLKIKDRKVNKFNILVRRSNNNSSNQNNLNQARVVGDSNNSNDNNNQSQVENNNKWVINLLKTNLTEGQISVLAKGPNYAITPRYIPNLDYITAIQSVSHKLKEEDVGELRVDINSLLRRAQVPKSNLTMEESIGLAHLKKGKDRGVLTADKGMAMIVMDKEDYIERQSHSLNNQPINP